MKHLLLKFNHGVEIGARLAYIGHFKRTKEIGIKTIIDDEYEHRLSIKSILYFYDQKPSFIIDSFFYLVGRIIQYACTICPLWSLDMVARIMESFAIINYNKLAKLYPKFRMIFNQMALKEEEHKMYFKRLNVYVPKSTKTIS